MNSATAPIRSDRRFLFDAERTAVWAAISQTDRYGTWWPWLHEFEAAPLAPGARWQCTVKPPLPYTVRFAVAVLEVVEHELVRARVEGDITGWAELIVSDRDGGCELRLVSELRPANRALRLVARVARPVASFGHDWVLDTGAHQFRTVALRR